MRVLALDLGTKCGWALLEPDGKVYHGVEDLKRSHWFGHDSFKAFDEFLCHKLHNQGETLVLVEKPQVYAPGYHAKRVLFGMVGVVQMRIPDDSVIYYSTTSIKKHITGKGSWKGEDNKLKMIEALIGIYPDLKDHNEADALGLLHYYMDGFPWVTEED